MSCLSLKVFLKLQSAALLSNLSSLLEDIVKLESSSEKHKQQKKPSMWNQFQQITLPSISFWRWKMCDFFLLYLKFAGFEFYFSQACVNLDFYLIIDNPELPVRPKSDRASDTTQTLSSLWFMDDEFALW